MWNPLRRRNNLVLPRIELDDSVENVMIKFGDRDKLWRFLNKHGITKDLEDILDNVDVLGWGIRISTSTLIVRRSN